MQTKDIYLDRSRPGGENCVLNGASSSLATANHQFVQGDKLRMRLHFRTSTGFGTTSTPVSLDAGDVLAMVGKVSTTPGATDALFSCTSFTKTDITTDIYYEGVLDLNTVEIGTALGSALYIDSVVDVEVQNSDNSERVTYRLTVRINKQAYAGTEGTTSGNPPYPAPANVALNAPVGGLQKCIDGVWHMKNVTSGQWHPYWLEGNPPQFTFGPGVDA